MDRALLSAIASPRRREILRLLWVGERAVGDIHHAMPDVTLGAVSLQLKTLVDAGLIESRAERQQRFYRVCRQRAEPVAAMLEQMWDDRLWQLKLAAELEETRRGPRPAGRGTPPRRASAERTPGSASPGGPHKARATKLRAKARSTKQKQLKGRR
jgi:DNA-binding transcriptional ArsR family regulator